MLYIIFSILATVSLIYYIVFVCFTAFSISFDLIWVFISLGSLLGILANYTIRKKQIKINKYIKCTIGTVIILAIIIFVGIQYTIVSYGNMEPIDNAEYVIVLGARLHGDIPSLTLRERLDTAADYLNNNPESKAIVSGGQGDDEWITEAEAMKKYLMEKGIDESRIIEEGKATSTYENFLYSFEIIEESGSEIDSINVITSEYHVYRAIKLGEKLGGTNLKGVSAPTHKLLVINFYTREAFAIIKDFLVGNI